MHIIDRSFEIELTDISVIKEKTVSGRISRGNI